MNRALRLLVLLPLVLTAAALANDEPALFSGSETFTLEAGQHAAFRWIPERRGFEVLARPGIPAPLPGDARPALASVPAWLRGDTERQLRRLLLAPISVEKGPAKPSFRDVNEDGIDDLVILDGAGRMTAFLAPHWERALEMKAATGIVAEIEDPARGDVDGDGRLDEVKGTEDGRILWRRNRGGGFLDFRTTPTRTFPFTVGTAARPALFDGHLVTGNLDGELSWYRARKDGVYRPRKKPLRETPEGLGAFIAPALGILTGGEKPDLVVGDETGALSGPGLDPAKHRVESFASPCLVDIDGDGDLDLVCGSGDGSLTAYTNEGEPGKPSFGRLIADLDLLTEDFGDSSAPAAGDLNGDGHVDLIVGNQAGELRVFLGPDWTEDTTLFGGLDLGELTAPALAPIAPKDGGGWRLVVGRLDGDLIHYVITSKDGKLSAVETNSWDWEPDQRSKDLAAYYERVYLPEWEEMRGVGDRRALDSIVEVLTSAPKDHVDEIAFAVANTPAEVLRAMARMGETDILARNAARIYEVAGRVEYAKLVEKDDHTTIAFAGDDLWAEAPRDVYYWWVVHPRILYEIPSSIDDSWWRTGAKERGLSDSEWWKHEADGGVHAPRKGAFWREGFLEDARFGGSLLGAVTPAKTLREAHSLVHRHLAHGVGFMRFGYETQDLQPWLIYAKHYGSCGEHSIIGAAMARTMLIPTSVVGCRGEDHQWNEWWDVDGKWHHWDCCGPDGIDNPYYEGPDHTKKTVSTVTRWRGDDFHDATTTTIVNDPERSHTKGPAGYTDVCDVTVRVVDPADRPVDGALVIVRSHWNRRNLVSIWGYTDFRGEVKFGLGYEPHGGYRIEALTPAGPCGVVNYPVVENTRRTLVLRTPSEKPPFTHDDRVKESTGKANPTNRLAVHLEASELSVPNFITANRFRIGDHLTKNWGYRGTRRTRLPIDPENGPEVLIFDPEEYEEYVAGEEVVPIWRGALTDSTGLFWAEGKDREFVAVISNANALVGRVRVRVEERPTGRRPAPKLELDADSLTVKSGSSVVISGTLRHDRGLEPLAADFVVPVDIVGPDADGRFRVTVDAGRGGPLPSGTWNLTITARDAAGTTARASIPVTVESARVFKGQRIRQDDPDDPLKNPSWIYGPFDLEGTDRFLLVRTKSGTPDFDMDLRVYRDGNGNGKIDGPQEKLAESTSPTAKERIYLEKPEAGTYWVHCQGWQVKGDVALLDVEIYPAGTPRRIGVLSPVGPIAVAPEVVEVTFPATAAIQPEKVRVSFGGKDVTKQCTIEPYRLRFVPPEGLEENESHEVTVRVDDANGGPEERTFDFTIDTLPPVLASAEPVDPPPEKGQFLLVTATD
ncbi:MAG: FG-GAP-like repeat-containing protein, partial [Planctomycetota bacterium]